jgi:hypothetical protein
MSKPYIFFGLAVIMGLLIPLVPRMIQVRIAVLRKLHLNWLADFHERHLEGLTWFVRALLAILAVLLVWVATSGSHPGP